MTKRKKILALMCLTMLLGYLPWYNFSAVLKYIAAEFELTSGDIGIILAAIQFGYIVVVLFTGWLSDKIGENKVLAWATLLTGIFSTSFIWLAQGFKSILILRLLTGLSAGAIYAPGVSLLSNWFSSKERGMAIGAYTGALTAAYAGGYFIASPLASAYGWRSGVLWTSLPVFVAAFILFFFVENKPPEHENPDNYLLETKKSDLINIKAKPAPEGGYTGPVVITSSYMGHMWELYAFWGWIGPFLVACSIAVGFEESAAVAIGGQLAAFVILFGVPAVYLWGMYADKVGRTKAIIIAAFCSLTAEFFLGFMFGHSLIITTIVAFWIGFWVIADSAIYKAGLTDMVAPRIRTTSIAVQSAIGYTMTIASPICFGKILEFQNGAINPIYAEKWGLPFLLLGLGALFSPLFAVILRRLPQAKLMAKGKM
ncbi:MAG: MFS transporter [Firmicutes bacterium HGW-Firmicutes-12]|nr:MAG: MFS transporter [Firmicutes bacterium HGW-Firmicutes-12]